MMILLRRDGFGDMGIFFSLFRFDRLFNRFIFMFMFWERKIRYTYYKKLTQSLHLQFNQNEYHPYRDF